MDDEPANGLAAGPASGGAPGPALGPALGHAPGRAPGQAPGHAPGTAAAHRPAAPARVADPAEATRGDETAPDDRALARAAGAGDRAAFAALVERHYDRIHRLAWRLTGQAAAADDLAQDTCVALARRIASYRGEAAFTTWLYRLVVNAARDRYRAESRAGRLAAAWVEVRAMAEADAVAAEADSAWLAEAMATLKPDLRETVALVVGEELSHAEAGEALGIGAGTVSWRMAEVRKHLRALAGDAPADAVPTPGAATPCRRGGEEEGGRP